MSEKTQKAQKQSWFKGVNSEFKKIIWTDKKGAVVFVSVALGVIIAIVDFAAQYGVDLLVR